MNHAFWSFLAELPDTEKSMIASQKLTLTNLHNVLSIGQPDAWFVKHTKQSEKKNQFQMKTQKKYFQLMKKITRLNYEY